MIEVLVDGLPEGGPGGVHDLLVRAVRAACAARGAARGTVSLTLLDDGAIRVLNRDHLGHDRPTDVIAFALWEEGEPVVGDVYVGLAQAGRQADEEGVPLERELVRLAVHGTLHVLGMDHPDDPGARDGSEMYRLQERLVEAVAGT